MVVGFLIKLNNMKTLEEIKKEYYRKTDEMGMVDIHQDSIWQFIESTISQTKQELIDENTSDGYHTFKELYEFRKVYNAVLFNEWSRQGKYNVHKSYRHNDKELCFGGGWFIVMATLPTGQISNHYESKDWELFKCEERDFADEWDGHTAQDVVKRLLPLEKLSNK